MRASSRPHALCSQQLVHLQVLGSNRLAEVPLSIAALPKLARLDLSANLLVTVPPALGHIKTFKELDLRYSHTFRKDMPACSEGGLASHTPRAQQWQLICALLQQLTRHTP